MRVRRVVGPAQAEQQVDLIDAREVAGIGAAVDILADPVRLVIGPNAVKETVGVQPIEQDLVGGDDVFERLLRRPQQVEGHRVGDAQRQDAHERIGRTLVGEHAARVVVQEEVFGLE